MTRYYFASRYSRHPEMRDYRTALTAAIPGAVVTSRWIDCHDDELEQSYTPEVLNADPAGCWRHGSDDLDDLEAAHVLVSFTGPGGKGGRHVEHGYFLAMQLLMDADLRSVIVGPRENVFHCLPETEHFPDFDAFLKAERALTAGGDDA